MVRTFNIKDAYVPELIEVFGVTWLENIIVDGIEVPNPQTKAAYASEKFDEDVINYIRERVQNYRTRSVVIDQTLITE